jgi:hypothetical protein
LRKPPYPCRRFWPSARRFCSWRRRRSMGTVLRPAQRDQGGSAGVCAEKQSPIQSSQMIRIPRGYRGVFPTRWSQRPGGIMTTLQQRGATCHGWRFCAFPYCREIFPYS